ncbi:MAG: DUF4349 domain-containing protein [Anaerolineales bacterium]|nr:DUF4349 domain-containing protein [Anaerolineales bacterium]
MKKTLITIGVTTVVVLTLIGIVGAFSISRSGFSPISQGFGGGGYDDYALSEPASAPAPGAPAEFFAADSAAYEESAVAFNTVAQSQERLVIQNVDMSLVVADPKARMEEIGDLAVEMGGFVVSSNLYQSQFGPNQIEVPGANMTIRVPSERLDEALEKIKEDVVKVTYENRSGEDVTSQYVDLESRLSAKRAAETKLLEILEQAQTTEDTLAVYSQLQQIQSEIEVLVGQMKYYQESAALSAVSIQLVAEETVKPIEIGGWRLQGTANDAVQDLIRFTQSFVQFLIRFVLFNLPTLILIAIPLYLVFLGGRTLFRRFRKAKPEADVKEEKK